MFFTYKHYSLFFFLTVFSAQAMDPPPIEGIGYHLQHRPSKHFLHSDRAKVTVQAAKPKSLEQQWVFHRVDNPPANGSFYLLQNRGSGRFLYARCKTCIKAANPFGSTCVACHFIVNPQDSTSHEQFSIHSIKEGGKFYNLKHRQSEHFLDSDGNLKRKNNVYIDCHSAQPTNFYQQWSIVPADYVLRAEIRDFNYTGAEQINLEALSFCSKDTWVMVNDTDLPYTKRPEITWSRETTHAWSFTESRETRLLKKFDVKVSAKLLRPLVEDISASYTTEWTTQEKTLTETMERSVQGKVVSTTAEITIPAHKEVSYEVLCKKFDKTIPFTATAKVFGIADCMKRDGTLEEGKSLTADDVKVLMWHAGYEGENMRQEENEEAISVDIKGFLKVTASFDIKTQLKMRPFPLLNGV